MATRPHTRTRPNPTISANELAKYLVSGDHAREGILRRAKEVSTAAVIRYRDLRQGLVSYLSNAERPRARLVELEQHLRQRADDTSLSPFHREDATASLEALEAFHRLNNRLGGMSLHVPERWNGALMIEGVAVNVSPDLALIQDARTGPRYGVLIMRFAKGEDRESEAAAGRRAEIGRYVATLAYLQAQAQCLPDHTAHHSLCHALDVQNEEMIGIGPSQTRRVNDITAACRGIARAWPLL